LGQGDGDLTNRLPMYSKNEIGQLIRWFNEFISNQMNMIKRVKNSLKASKKTVKTVSSSNEKIHRSMQTIENMVKTLSSIGEKSSKEALELVVYINKQTQKLSKVIEG
jgi:methyl-accepting chemotaxis protein